MNLSSLSRLSFFKAEKYEFKKENICDFQNIPRPHFCMGLIIKGNALFSQYGKEDIFLSSGDIIFVPITSQYISKWQGDPDILYISMHFAFEPLSGISQKERFALQKVDVPDFGMMKNKFETVLDNYNSEKLSEQFSAVGEFYNILSEILPRLAVSERIDHDVRLDNAIDYINLHSEESISVSKLARLSNMSIANFHRYFKQYTKMTPIEYKNNICIRRAMCLLKSDEKLSIEEISEKTGFYSSTYFRRTFKKITGCTPTEYRKYLAG